VQPHGFADSSPQPGGNRRDRGRNRILFAARRIDIDSNPLASTSALLRLVGFLIRRLVGENRNQTKHHHRKTRTHGGTVTLGCGTWINVLPVKAAKHQTPLALLPPPLHYLRVAAFLGRWPFDRLLFLQPLVFPVSSLRQNSWRASSCACDHL
jgi:hypothetical protein